MRTLSWMRKNGARTLTSKNLVEALFGGVENIAAVGQRGGVDQRVDAAEALVRLGDHLAAVGDAGEIRLNEYGRTARRRNVARDPFPSLGVAAADHESRGAALAEQPRDGLPQALRAAGDDGDLAGEIRRPSIGRTRGGAGLRRGGFGHGRFSLSAGTLSRSSRSWRTNMARLWSKLNTSWKQPPPTLLPLRRSKYRLAVRSS